MSINTYDKYDRVDRVAVIHAGAMKLGAYRVRDPETDEWSALQFHMVYDNTVMAMMSESAAKLFAKFITDNTEPSHREPFPLVQTLGSQMNNPSRCETASKMR